MSLTPEEAERYQWQTWTEGFGEAGQEKLKSATVFISRIGGIGGMVAMQLAAAGVGRLVLAHGGTLRRNDLNRQLLMSTERIGQARTQQAADRLRQINPNVIIDVHEVNVSAQNATALTQGADIVVSAAPLFEERLAMNAAAVHAGVPVVHCAMFDMECHVLVTRPHETACLACITPEPPAWWKREFPVFGAVAGTAGSMAAMEVIKLLSGLGADAAGTLSGINFRTGHMQSLKVARDPGCPVCSSTLRD